MKKINYQATDSNYIVTKINEICDWINLQENSIDDKIDELWADNEHITYFGDKEMEVIKKCLVYCRHRLTEHHSSGIRKALSAKETSLFQDIIKKL